MTHSFPTRRASDLSKQAKRRERGEAIDSGPNVPRPEVTSTCQTYIDLHRHAAVRAALTGHPKVALRLMVAHAITGSYLWRVKPEPQTCRNEAARASVETCRPQAEFDAKRRAVRALPRFSAAEQSLPGATGPATGSSGLFLTFSHP